MYICICKKATQQRQTGLATHIKRTNQKQQKQNEIRSNNKGSFKH